VCSQATSGLGRAAAAALAAEGYHVVLGEDSRESCLACARTPSSTSCALIVCIVHIAQLAMSASLIVSLLVSVCEVSRL
jgi:NAD(P)-dependent dehydrogenase (short-subunit alcohol dehydrogenase family)